MDIAAYQRWFVAYDRARGFDLAEPSQATVHMMEEVGEIAREILYLEGYRDPSERADAVARLAEEIGDVIVFLTKLAARYGIELDDVVQNLMVKAEARWPVDDARREMARYIARQEAACARRAVAWQERQDSER